MLKIFKKNNDVNKIINKLNDLNKKYYLDLATITIASVFAIIKTVKKHEMNVVDIQREIEELKSKGE